MLPPHRVRSLPAPTLSFAVAFALTMLGCSRPPASAPEAAAPEEASASTPKQDISTLFAREAGPEAVQRVQLSGAVSAAAIESKTPPKLGKEGEVLTVDADLGWDGPVKCFLYPEEIDAGGTVAHLLSRLATAAKMLKVEPYAIESAGVDPIVFVRALYEMPSENGKKAIGDLKIMVTPRDPGAVMCVLDAPGFAVSFQRVAADFARSFELSEKPEPAKREELWVTMLGDMPMGFTRWRLLPGGDKSALMSVSTTSRLLPSSETELSTNDSVSVVFLDKQGALVEGTWAEFDGGEETLLAKLSKTKKGYEYSGKLQGKTIQGSFSSKQPLTDDYAMYKRFAELARAGKPASFELTSYSPSVDPTGGSVASYALAPSENGVTVEGKLGKVTAYMSADAKGALRSYRMPAGGREVSSKLVFEQGAL